MTKKVAAYFLLIVTGLLLTFLSYKLAFFIGEKYFFDKLFYQKSALHGYVKESGDVINHTHNNPSIEKRIADIKTLVDIANGKSKVLGTNSDEYVVALIGDSLVYGTGIKNEERFGSILEKKLNEIRPTRVLILAQPGDSVLDNYAKYLLAEQYYHPNLYIIGLVDNDLLFAGGNKYPGEKDIYDQFTQECGGKEYAYDWQLGDNTDWLTAYSKANRNSFSDDYSNICFLKKIMGKINNKNVIYFGYNLPGTFEIDPSYTELGQNFIFVMKRYLQPILENGGTVLGVKGNWQPISEKEAHPSMAANQQYADILFKEIKTNPKWKFQQ